MPHYRSRGTNSEAGIRSLPTATGTQTVNHVFLETWSCTAMFQTLALKSLVWGRTDILPSAFKILKNISFPIQFCLVVLNNIANRASMYWIPKLAANLSKSQRQNEFFRCLRLLLSPPSPPPLLPLLSLFSSHVLFHFIYRPSIWLVFTCHPCTSANFYSSSHRAGLGWGDGCLRIILCDTAFTQVLRMTWSFA